MTVVKLYTKKQFSCRRAGFLPKVQVEPFGGYVFGPLSLFIS